LGSKPNTQNGIQLNIQKLLVPQGILPGFQLPFQKALISPHILQHLRQHHADVSATLRYL